MVEAEAPNTRLNASENSSLNASTQTRGATCPHCGATDTCTPALQLRSSFSLGAFLMAGIFGVIFRNSSRPRRLRCAHCETVFSVRTPGSKLSLVVFWLLVAPGFLFVAWVLYALTRLVLSR